MEIIGEFLDYDPLTGVLETYKEEDGKVHISTYHDMEPYLKMAAHIANTGSADENWTKNEVATFAIIPPVVQAELFKKGINFMDPNDIGKVVREMSTTYSKFRTTYKHHEVRS